MTTETDLMPLPSAKGLAMRMIVWMFGEPSFYVTQHHGGGTARHGPYPLAKAKEECERFRRSGFSSWVENKSGPHFRSPHQPDFHPVDCFKEPPHV